MAEEVEVDPAAGAAALAAAEHAAVEGAGHGEIVHVVSEVESAVHRQGCFGAAAFMAS